MFLKAHKDWLLKEPEILVEHFILYFCIHGGQDALS
jgi:hypothetical protein